MDNKTLVNRLAKQTNSDVKTVTTMLSGLAKIMTDSASVLDTIAIPGFGNFVAMKKGEHIIYDSSTGKRMLVPPKITVEFVAGSKLKKRVSNE